jgi:hypothetical protein
MGPPTDSAHEVGVERSGIFPNFDSWRIGVTAWNDANGVDSARPFGYQNLGGMSYDDQNLALVFLRTLRAVPTPLQRQTAVWADDLLTLDEKVDAAEVLDVEFAEASGWAPDQIARRRIEWQTCRERVAAQSRRKRTAPRLRVERGLARGHRQNGRREAHSRPQRANAPPSDDRPDDPDAAARAVGSAGSHLAGLRPYAIALAVVRRELAQGPRPALEVEAAARRAGASPRTVDKARADLGVVSHRTGFGPGSVCYMSLPYAPHEDLVTFVGPKFVRTPSRRGETQNDQAAHHLERVDVARARLRAAVSGRLAVAS